MEKSITVDLKPSYTIENFKAWIAAKEFTSRFEKRYFFARKVTEPYESRITMRYQDDGT